MLCSIALTLLGVKLVLANALLAGLLNVIPNVGPTMSTIFPMAGSPGCPWSAAVLGAYVVIQNIESYVITPSVMHHQVRLLPGLTLAAQFLFTFFGPLGLLMALPLAVVLQVIIREVLIHDVLDRWKRLEPARPAFSLPSPLWCWCCCSGICAGCSLCCLAPWWWRWLWMC